MFSGFTLIFISIARIESQPYGPKQQQQLTTTNLHQEFCVYTKNKFVHPNVQVLKSISLPESEQCTLFCSLEPDCFVTQYNPANGQCKMYSRVTTCGNYKWMANNQIFSWKANFISNSEMNKNLCEQHALAHSIYYGGGCTALPGKGRQSFSDGQYYYRYGAISAVKLWSKGYFRALQFRYGTRLSSCGSNCKNNENLWVVRLIMNRIPYHVVVCDSSTAWAVIFTAIYLSPQHKLPL